MAKVQSLNGLMRPISHIGQTMLHIGRGIGTQIQVHMTTSVIITINGVSSKLKLSFKDGDLILHLGLTSQSMNHGGVLKWMFSSNSTETQESWYKSMLLMHILFSTMRSIMMLIYGTNYFLMMILILIKLPWIIITIKLGIKIQMQLSNFAMDTKKMPHMLSN